jgi:phage antirepressor YoqD-like protein
MTLLTLSHQILKQKIHDLLRANSAITKRDLADQLGVTYTSLQAFLKKAGITIERPRRNRLKAPQLNSRAFRVLGYLINHPHSTLQHVADQFHVTREYVSQIEVKAKAAGIIR